MSSPSIPGLSSNFNEPQTDDNTSAAQPVQPQVGPVQQALSQKKKKPFGANVKNPGALKAAIARSRRARQGGDKWGL